MLNGDPFELDGSRTVSQLLLQLGIDARRVAVEHNLVVLKRGLFDTVEIHDGDEIEIVNFVGGGSYGIEPRNQEDTGRNREFLNWQNEFCILTSDFSIVRESAKCPPIRSSSQARPSPPVSSSARASIRRRR
ncbi:MAG: sulfur carrier protein ThiS [Acidobacteriota bacterium]